MWPCNKREMINNRDLPVKTHYSCKRDCKVCFSKKQTMEPETQMTNISKRRSILSLTYSFLWHPTHDKNHQSDSRKKQTARIGLEHQILGLAEGSVSFRKGSGSFAEMAVANGTYGCSILLGVSSTLPAAKLPSFAGEEVAQGLSPKGTCNVSSPLVSLSTTQRVD